MEIDKDIIETITNEILKNIRAGKINELESSKIAKSKLPSDKESISQANINTTIVNVLAEIQSSLLEINKEKIQELIELITTHERIFIAGIGRSGLICKLFIMRLMQIGFNVFVVGETTTPAIESSDLLMTISGSGKTSNSVNIIKKAKEIGAYTFLITAKSESPMAKIADSFVSIPAPTKNGIHETGSQFIGSLFEQSAFMLLECIINILFESLKLKPDDIMKRHANLE